MALHLFNFLFSPSSQINSPNCPFDASNAFPAVSAPLIDHRAVSALSLGELQLRLHTPLNHLAFNAFTPANEVCTMAEANFDVNQSRRKFEGSLNIIQNELGVLYQMYESLQAQHTEKEAELKRAQDRIEFLGVESASNVTQAVQIINSGAIDDTSLSTRLNKIYDSIEAWSLTIMPLETDLSEKWPLISLYMTANCLIQPGNTTFNRYFKGTNPELISAIIMAVLSKMLFLNAVAGMLPEQALVLRQLQNSISLVQPYKSKTKTLGVSFHW